MSSTWIKRSGAAVATISALGLLAPTVAHATTGNLAHQPIRPNILPEAPLPKAPSHMTYQVQSGDSVWLIAQRTGTSTSAIIKANNLDSSALIHPGQLLKIPVPTSTSVTSGTKVRSGSKDSNSTSSSKSSTATTVYVVKSGDTLGKIALQYNTTVTAIASANSISNPNRIHVGQRLTIGGRADTAKVTSPSKQASSSSTPKPSKPESKPAQPSSKATTYTVKRGDTLGAIARAHNTSVSAIASANGISNPNRLSVGQKLTIGATATPTTSTSAPKPAPAPAPAPQPAPSKGVVYVVKSGDNLGSIARAHNTTVSAIAAANGISNPNRLSVGQKLTIGGTATASSNSSANKKPQLVTNNFPGYTYADSTVAAANENKHSLISKSVPSRAEMQRIVADTARSMGVDPKLALAHAYVESGFDATAVSPANAIGTMQVIPSSGKWASQLVGRELDLLDPYDNVVAGVAIIRSLHRSTSNFDHAVGGYYQGLGGVQKYGMRSDTVAYVAKIKAAMNRF